RRVVCGQRPVVLVFPTLFPSLPSVKNRDYRLDARLKQSTIRCFGQKTNAQNESTVWKLNRITCLQDGLGKHGGLAGSLLSRIDFPRLSSLFWFRQSSRSSNSSGDHLR